MCLNTIGWNLHLQPLTIRAQHVPASKLPEYWPTSSNKIVSPGLPHNTPYYPITGPCPLERNIHKTNSYKSDKYYDTQSDLEKKGWKVYLVPFEMSSRGQILKHTQTDIFTTLTHFNIRVKLKKKNIKNMKSVSKIFLLWTFSIFQAYQTKEWVNPAFLRPKSSFPENRKPIWGTVNW